MALQLGRITINDIDLVELDSNPALGSGFTADVGDQAFDATTGVQYCKFGAGVNDWMPNVSTRFETTATSAAGTKTLTALSSWLQFLTGTATGFSVVLPDATTLVNGLGIVIHNQSSQSVLIKTNGGATLATLAQTSIGFLTLQSNGTAAGTWAFYQLFTTGTGGVVYYSVTSSTVFTTSSPTDVVITGMTTTPVAGTYAIWFNDSMSTSNANRTVSKTIYKGGAAITDSLRTATPPNANQGTGMSTMTISGFDGAQACDIRAAISSGTLTVNQRSMLLIRLGV